MSTRTSRMRNSASRKRAMVAKPAARPEKPSNPKMSAQTPKIIAQVSMADWSLRARPGVAVANGIAGNTPNGRSPISLDGSFHASRFLDNAFKDARDGIVVEGTAVALPHPRQHLLLA